MNYYLTTPLYYVNAAPHLGHAYTTVIADCLARYHRLNGDKVFFLTGTDEHGQKLQEKAESMKLEPKAFIDTMIPAFKKTWSLYEIEHTKFIRTTDPEHYAGVTVWIKKMIEQGDIYKSTYTGWYCVPCEAFMTIGGDVIKDEQGAYVCPIHKKPLRELEEESYFFRLSAYEDQLLKFYEEHPDFITPKERMQEVISFVKSGLKDLSISRKTVSWGIPFPGDPTHTVYVWADALNNYLTAIGYGNSAASEELKKWWPADVHVMAKDIVRFHAVYWPAFLIAAGLPQPKKLLVHGYVLMNEQKMSKSLGNAGDPEQLAEWYGVEPVRYYLLRQMAITHDGNFDLKDLEERISADLANNLGNLLNRMATLALNNGLTTVTAPVTLEAKSAALKEKGEEAYRLYWDEMNKYFVHLALAEAWKFISEINAYFHAQEPWKLAKQNKELFAEVIASTCHSLYAVALMLWPVMPKKMEELLQAIGHKLTLGVDHDSALRENKWNKTFTLSKMGEPLFVKPETRVVAPETTEAAPAAAPAAPEIPEIGIEDFIKIQLVAVTILSCEPVPGSDKLYKLEVDAGHLGKRQVLSGVAQHFKPEDLIGKQGVCVANLKPRKMMGLLSHGMMLFADDAKGRLHLTTIDGSIENGSRVK